MINTYYKNIFLTTASAMALLFLCNYSAWSNEASDREVFVAAVKGDAKAIPAGSSLGTQCTRGMRLRPGDWIKTGENSSVTLSFDKGGQNAITLQDDSLMIIKLDGYFKVQLLKGKVYAILENVAGGEIFRVLAPSVVTESTASGWTLDAQGIYNSVIVCDGEAYVCGINKDGTVKQEKFAVKEGYGRLTKGGENPEPPTKASEDVVSWFRAKVVEHHLNKAAVKKLEQEEMYNSEKKDAEKTDVGGLAQGKADRSTQGKNVFIVDGKEYDLLEYIYSQRLKEKK